MSDPSANRTEKNAAPQTWLVVASMVALSALSYPLAWFPAGSVPHRFEIQVPWAVVFLSALLLILLRSLRMSNTIELPRIRIDRTILAVIGVGVISVVLSSNVVFSTSTLCLLLANVALFYSTAVWFDLRRVPILLGAWLAVATIEAWYAVWQIAPTLREGLQDVWAESESAGAGSPMWKVGFWTSALRDLTAHGGRAVATIGNKDWVAGYLAVSAFVCFPLWVWAKGKRIHLLLLGFCYLVLVVGVCFCASTGAWIALGVGALICAFRIGWEKRRVMTLLGAGIVLVIVATIALSNFDALERYWGRNVRPPIWRGVLHMIQDSPLIGTGLGTFPYQYAQYRPAEYYTRPQATNYTDHAHNEFLEIAAESGLFGLGVMLWLLGIIFVRGWRGWQQAGEHRWTTLAAWGAVIVVVVHNQFDINLRWPPNQTLWWLLMGLVIRCTRSPIPEPADLKAEAKPVLPPRIGRPTMVGTFLFLSLMLLYFQVIKPVASDMYYRRALIARGREDWKSAIQNYERALKYEPYRVEAWYRLAWICAQFPETTDQAIQYYQQVVELAPDYGDVNSNLAFLYYRDGRKKEAVVCLERMVELNPNNCEGRATLARVYLELGLDRDARREVLALLNVCPDHPWAKEIWEEKFRKEPAPTGPEKKKPRNPRPRRTTS